MNTSTTALSLRKKLLLIKENQPNSLKGAVAQEALEDETSEITSFFSGLLEHGCVSGWVNSLVWYNQTHAFYDKHYNEIEELRQDYEESLGQPMSVKSDYKNFMAWFAFEETAYQLAMELGLEI